MVSKNLHSAVLNVVGLCCSDIKVKRKTTFDSSVMYECNFVFTLIKVARTGNL